MWYPMRRFVHGHFPQFGKHQLRKCRKVLTVEKGMVAQSKKVLKLFVGKHVR